MPLDGWTVDGLPDDARCALVDGGLLVTPPRALRQGRAVMALALLPSSAAPPELRVLTTPGLRFDARSYRQPEVVLYRREAAARDLLLVVHRLRGPVSEVAGKHNDVVALDEPVPLAFRLVDLLA